MKLNEHHAEHSPDSYLLDGKHIGGHKAARWLGGQLLAKSLDASAAAVQKQIIERQVDLPPIGVVIDGRRPKYPGRLAEQRSLPGSTIDRIKLSLDGIAAQQYPEAMRRQTIVMVDDTMAIRQRDLRDIQPRAWILPVSHAISHPAGWNKGLAVAKENSIGVAMLLNAGSHYATNQAFHAAALTVNRESALAAFGSQLADGNSSVLQSIGRNLRTLNALDQGTQPRHDVVEDARFIPIDGMAYNLTALPADPFDLRFGRGGANNDLLKGADKCGERVLYHSALSVQSGELLGPVALASVASERTSLMRPNEYTFRT